MERKKTVAVIFGGQSSEHEVSRVSAQSVITNIDRSKYDVVMVGITRDGRWLHYTGPVEKIGSGEWEELAESGLKCGMEQLPDITDESCHAAGRNTLRGIFRAIGAETPEKPIDAVFPVLHGKNGEDGTIQGLFELADIPYVGSGVLASSLGMDKAYSKILFAAENIPQAKYLVFSRKQVHGDIDAVVETVERELPYPCFVKPSNSGSSVGVSKARNREELLKALELACRHDRRILVEEFINAREIECAVLGNDEPLASVVGEIIPGAEFYDYDDKYKNNRARIEIPADLQEETAQLIRSYAVRAYKALDCAGLARVDFFVHKQTGEVYINEINTIPGFTDISMYSKLWAASGLPYPELISRLIELAFERYEDSRGIRDCQNT